MKRLMMMTSAAILAALVAGLVWNTRNVAQADVDANPEPKHDTVSALQRSQAPERRRAVENGPNAFKFHAAPGTEMRFHWTSRFESKLGAKDGSAHAGPSFSLDGQLKLAIRSRDAEELVYELRFGELKAEALGAAQADAAAQAIRMDLQAGVLVRMDDHGQIRGYRFADSVHVENRSWLRAIANVLRVTLDRTDAEAWTSEETDSTGRVSCATRWSGPARDSLRPFASQRLRYLDATERTPKPVIESRIEGTFDAELGWLTRTKANERTVLEIAAFDLRVETLTQIDCVLGEVGEATASACAFSSVESPLSGAADAEAAHAATIEADWRRELEHVTTDDLIRALAELARGDLASPELLAVRERLVMALKLWPARVAELMLVVQSGSLDDNTLMVALSALGAAKHDTAQKALAECMAENQPEKVRVFAMRSLFQVDAPHESAVAAAVRATRDGGSELIASTGLLLVGAFANKDAKCLGPLLGLESEAVSHKQLDSWLQALGNSRSPDALPAAHRHAGADDPAVRGAALDALGAIPGDVATDSLAERVRVDTRVDLRSKAAVLLGQRDGSRSLVAADRLLGSESSDDVRMSLLNGLARRHNDASAQRLIERAAASDASTKVREHAANLLRPS